MMPINLRFFLSYNLRKTVRHLQNFKDRNHFARKKITTPIGSLVFEYHTPLFRNLPGVPQKLFEQKKTNLALAIKALNGICIRPHEIFSFWYLVKNPSAKRGYVAGLVIQHGKASQGIGGGLCQMANTLLWPALHTPLEITERHRHSLDLFPDDHRQVPFGTGATIVYNYRDLRFYNPSPFTFQFKFELTERKLIGRIYSDSPLEGRYEVLEKNARFEKRIDGFYRLNEIYRVFSDRQNHRTETLLFKNDCKCQYTPNF